MAPDVTLVTPTADQPTGMALCERYMAAQTAWDRVAEWIVVDDGEAPARPTMGQSHVRRRRAPGCSPAQSLGRNLLAVIPRLTTEFIIIIEHDDCYHPFHLERLLAEMEAPAVWAAGDDLQRYYHVGLRRWRTFDNWGAALCQTGLRRAAVERLRRAAEECVRQDWRGIDARFWSSLPAEHRATYRAEQVVGIKGLPGAPGIGIGHRPEESGYEWAEDPQGEKLREWCGAAAKHYLRYGNDREAAA